MDPNIAWAYEKRMARSILGGEGVNILVTMVTDICSFGTVEQFPLFRSRCCVIFQTRQVGFRNGHG